MQKLADIKGLSDAKVEKLLEAARKLCPNHGWLSAKTVEQQVPSIPTTYYCFLATSYCCIRSAMHAWTVQRSKEVVKITLGAQAINELLGGGLESKCITEIYGEFRFAIPGHAPFELCMQ